MLFISGWKFCITSATFKVLSLFIQEISALRKYQDPSWQSFNIGSLVTILESHRVIRGNWIPCSVSPYLELMSVDNGWLQYLNTALLPHQRNVENKQNVITYFTRHVFFILSLNSIAFLDVITANVSTNQWNGLLIFNFRGFILKVNMPAYWFLCSTDCRILNTYILSGAK